MKIHFIGIGGISMSALAKIMQSRGHIITGSDLNPVNLDGIETYTGHSVDHIKKHDLVVYTAAVKPDNPELRQARNLGIPVLERSELLGRISAEYGDCIAVSGTHGKTTTCGMLSSVLIKQNPTIHMGGNLPLINGNVRIGGDGLFITEACEYVRSFLTLSPGIAIILNISADHLDYYKDIEDIKDAFTGFAERIRDNGFLIINGDSVNCRDIKPKEGTKIITFGLSLDNDYAADGIYTDNGGYCTFNLVEKGQRKGEFKLSVRGEHNVLNALPVIAAARLKGISVDEIRGPLTKFTGVDRRYENAGEINGARVFLDYAHHPEELVTSIKTARSMSAKKVVAVFQPHTYTRTKTLLEGFVAALSMADEIVIADIYAAREKAIPGVTSQLLAEEINQAGKKAVNPHSFGEIYSYLETVAETDDIVLILGAGDIERLAGHIKKTADENAPD